MEDKKSKKKEVISPIPEMIIIDKQLPNSMKSKKYQFSRDIHIKKRSNSTVISRIKNEVFCLKPFKKVWASINDKYAKTIKETEDFNELKKLVKINGIDENVNYIYLKNLKLSKDKNFEKEFEQYKYTLSFDKRFELSNKPQEEINMSLKDYFQKILLLIISEGDKFNANNILRQFSIDFDLFGILINPKNNYELFYCYMLNKFLCAYENMNINGDEPDYYISLLKEFISQKDLTPIKCLVLVWIFVSIDEGEESLFFESALILYDSILKKRDNNEIYCLPKERKKIKFIYLYQKIIEDNKLFIKNSYFGKDLKYIYDFFQEVIGSPLLQFIYRNIDGYSNILKVYNYSDITFEKIIFVPMLLNKTEYGLTQNNLDIILINSLPFNRSLDVLSKIHNYFFLYVTILHEQGFHYIRAIFNKLDPDISQDTPKNIFSDLTKDPIKLEMLKEDGDGGDKGETLIFGNKFINLKKLFYFSNISNYNKPLSDIEKEVRDLTGIEKIGEEDINNSFLRNILTVEEKNILLEGKYDKNRAKHLYIKSKKNKGFYIPFQFGRDKK